MESPVVKGDGKITLSFKDNQCVVETEYAPPPPPAPAVLSRESSLPFHQTILAGNPQGGSWLTALVVFQSIVMIVGVCLLIGMGVYLIHRDHEAQGRYEQAQVLLKGQEGSIQGLQLEIQKIQREIRHYQEEIRKQEPDKKEVEENPVIETNSNP